MRPRRSIPRMRRSLQPSPSDMAALCDVAARSDSCPSSAGLDPVRAAVHLAPMLKHGQARGERSQHGEGTQT